MGRNFCAYGGGNAVASPAKYCKFCFKQDLVSETKFHDGF